MGRACPAAMSARRAPGRADVTRSRRRDRLSAWLQEMPFERRIVLVTGRLDDDLAGRGRSGGHHLPTAQFSGTPDQIAAHSRQQQELLWKLHARLAQLTGRPAEEVAEDLRRGRYLDAREALDYGLIDGIRITR
jgi:hypothetical protein